MADDLEQEAVWLNDGEWVIYKRSDCVMIVDPDGRCRHESRGHLLTAIHLAIQLGKVEFNSTCTMDDALKLRAAKFRNPALKI